MKGYNSKRYKIQNLRQIMLSQLFSSINSYFSNTLLKILWISLLVSGILLNPFHSYPGRDAGIFMYVGSLILKGKVPYLDVWENKGPLVFYINALGLSLGDGSRWGIWFMEFLFLLGATWLCYSLIHFAMGKLPALIGVSLMVSAAENVLQGGNYSEEYSVLFSCLALWAFVRGVGDSKNKLFDVLIGLSLGFNVLLRPNNISMQVAVAGGSLILSLLTRDWKLLMRRAGLIVAGGMLVLVPTLLYFSARGALTEMINVVLVFNTQYSSDTDLEQVLSGIMEAVASIGIVFSIVTLIGYFLSLFDVVNGIVRKVEFAPLLLVLLIGLPVEILLSTLSGRNYLHYFIGWSSYFGVLCAYVVFRLSGAFTFRLERYAPPLLLVLVLTATLTKLETWKGYVTVLQNLGTGQTEYVDLVAAYLRENTVEQDKVLVWGFRPIINFVSDRESPVSFLPYPLVHVDTPLTNAWAGQFYSQFTSEPPKFIVNYIEPADLERIPDIDEVVRKEQRIRRKVVVLAGNLDETLLFIEENYIKVDTINGADIYQLKTGLP
jgi:hypothetical protein